MIDCVITVACTDCGKNFEVFTTATMVECPECGNIFVLNKDNYEKENHSKKVSRQKRKGNR